MKIRGFRVEPGEVAARLAAHPQIREAVVLARGEGAYVTWPPGGCRKRRRRPVMLAALHAWLAGALPDYMVPRSYVRLDALPLTPNGKLDKRALPAPTEDARVRGEYEAPQGDVETALAAQWCALLGLDQVGRHDSFFMLGGHSLLAMRLVSRLRRRGLCPESADDICRPAAGGDGGGLWRGVPGGASSRRERHYPAGDRPYPGDVTAGHPDAGRDRQYCRPGAGGDSEYPGHLRPVGVAGGDAVSPPAR
nr:hypothetical protein SYMBAF_60020 [Serratia symbiotica]